MKQELKFTPGVADSRVELHFPAWLVDSWIDTPSSWLISHISFTVTINKDYGYTTADGSTRKLTMVSDFHSSKVFVTIK